MIGTWRWNTGFGFLGAGLTVMFSIGSNPLTTMLLRSLYAFIAFFILAYAARAILGFILKPPGILAAHDEGTENAGTQLDYTTPDNPDELNDLLKAQMQGGAGTAAAAEAVPESEGRGGDFKPLNPPQLVTADNKSPEQLAHVLRHLTGE
ncbi:hypothetical protein ACX93W_02845 [Paenibacillus sp. CAU 1782]